MSVPPENFLKAILIILASCIVSYLFLLGLQVYSVFQVSRMLDRIERLRPGDPYTDYKSVVSTCKTSKTTSTHAYCRVIAGSYRFYWPWQVLQKVSDSLAVWVFAATSQLGLRYWDVVISADAKDNRLTGISVNLYVVGRYEALGVAWTRAATLPALHQGVALGPQDQHTSMNWYHITSVPSGEGFRVSTSDGSTEAELQARHFNRSCLLAFRGCDGLCELFPYAIPVLNERHRSWGGWCSVPRSWCASKVNADRTSE